MKTILLGLACFLALNAQALEPQLGKEPYYVNVEVQLACPMSEELTDFIKSVPERNEGSITLAEWQADFVKSMNQLIHLVESGKMENSRWTAHINSSDEVGQTADGQLSQ